MKLFDGSISDLYSKYGNSETLTVTVDTNASEIKFEDSVFKNAEITVEKNQIDFRYDINNTNHSVLLKELFDSCNVIDFSLKQTTIEDIIHDLYLYKDYETRK